MLVLAGVRVLARIGVIALALVLWYMGISAGFRPSRRFSLSDLYSVACVVSLASRNRLGAARELLDFAKANR